VHFSIDFCPRRDNKFEKCTKGDVKQNFYFFLDRLKSPNSISMLQSSKNAAGSAKNNEKRFFVR
jgi:hypothetical protein